MKAHFLIAIAENDDQKEPQAKDMLKEAFAKAHLPAEIEVYAGTKHGWCPPDSQVYNADQAEKAWSRMMVLFKTSAGLRSIRRLKALSRDGDIEVRKRRVFAPIGANVAPWNSIRMLVFAR